MAPLSNTLAAKPAGKWRGHGGQQNRQGMLAAGLMAWEHGAAVLPVLVSASLLLSGEW